MSAVEFLEYLTCLTLKSLSGRSGRTSIPGLFAQEGSTASDNRYQVSVGSWIELNFATFEPVLHWSGSVWKLRREAASFISAVSADIHLLPKAEGSIRIKSQRLNHLNFAPFVPVLHSSRSVLCLEASNQAIFPVESILGTSQGLNWSLTLLKFQDVWTGLTLKSLSVEASNPGMFLVEAVLLVLAYQWLNWSSLTVVEFLNFRTIELVLHSSCWVWKRPIQVCF